MRTHGNAVLVIWRKRYHVDRAQAVPGRGDVVSSICRPSKGRNGVSQNEAEDLLRWAAQTHEIGLAVTHSRYQQHSAYLLRHSELPGFSSREQSLLSRIVLSHRRKIVLPVGAARERFRNGVPFVRVADG